MKLKDILTVAILKAIMAAFRINGMSNRLENRKYGFDYRNIPQAAQWYDYTKNPIRMKKFIAGVFPKNLLETFDGFVGLIGVNQ